MKKFAFIAVAVGLASACTDASTALPLAPSYNAVHGEIAAPAVADGTVTQTSSDPELYSVEFGFEWVDAYPSLNFNHVSFDLMRSTSPGGPFVQVASENGGASSPYSATLLDSDVEPGTYWYCGKVMAMDKTITPRVTYHSSCSTPAQVVIGGDVYELRRIAAGNNGTETAAPGPLALSKTGSLTLYFVLYRNGALVNDCTTIAFGDVSATITFTAPGAASSGATASECAFNGAANRHRYKVTLTNHFNNQVGSGTIDLKIGGSTVTTYGFATS